MTLPSTDVAGLLAYLLSIYPSSTFNPVIKSAIAPAAANFDTSVANVFGVLQSALPAWLSGFLPSLPETVAAAVAPIPDMPTITTQQLKDALLALSTDGVLTGLPAKTVNKLIFNNATDAYGLF